MAPANDDRRFVTNLGELIASLADAADAVSDTEQDADDLVVATAFALQWSLRRATVASPDAETEAAWSELAVAADVGSGSESSEDDAASGRAA